MDPARLTRSFFERDVLTVAPELIGKILVRCYPDGSIRKFTITETEAYRGTEDLACHASKGRTPRTDVMFRHGGLVYVYLIYGMHWMLNFVAGMEGDASAILIRSLDEAEGPGRVGKILQLNRSLYGEDASTSVHLWLEDPGTDIPGITTHPRIGIHYAGEPWINKPWRFSL